MSTSPDETFETATASAASGTPAAPEAAESSDGGLAGPAAPAQPAPAVDVQDLPGGLEAALEAVLMVADSPVPTERLAAAVDLPVTDVSAALAGLAAEYRGEGGGRPRGFELREGAEGWRVYSSRAHADVVARLVLEGQSARLSQAALETLAVIAYRQPVTRGQVSAVRGVNVDGVVRTLLARGLVAEVGQDPLTGATLFGTTGEFLDRMGWQSLDELPPLAPHLPGIDALDALTDEHR
ncbi:segregation and condensation protein B [Xylanimonas oleitrophica]|uniref:Segregation and condensation protein B n=1 Tax=Xylanimonas oleitrophica TaxID=2607479 RepID=A0A2W5WL82_9MICO|nr:SMC-Scp complex subunit ScpB [Xylanimonas oleitrophica]PZR51940.1 segregation and condensation protein B [Xylanimonas oleitrophica]